MLALVCGGLFAWSFSRYVRDSEGEPGKVLLAEWARDHHLGWEVAQAENFYYDHIDVTPTGGKPTESTKISAGAGGQRTSGKSGAPKTGLPDHLNPPATVRSPVAHPLPDEGVWQPVGATVSGVPAVYATRVRADDVHTSVLASMMWIDTKLAAATFVPGYQEPGGPHPDDGALPSALQSRVLANFNGAF